MPVSAPLRLHVFQHVPHEDLGALAPLFAARGASVTVTRFFAGDAPPPHPDFDVLVVLGGPMNVYEHAAYPWLAGETEAIAAAVRAGRSVLGLCLGAQLLSVALGGTVTRSAHREIGWWPVERAREATGHPLADAFPPRFRTFHWHGDTFSIPPGAVRLFRSEGCDNQGFAFGERVVGLQFHPEITPDAVEAWIAAAGPGELDPARYVQDVAELAGIPDDFTGNNAWMEVLCGRLLA